MINEELAVKMVGITKRFPGVIANNNINFEVKRGEIHSLLGENGAGKTTLMNILYGLYAMDKGEIYIYGEKVDIGSPKDAIKLGIGMIHQHFTLVPPFTVTENIILGYEGNNLILKTDEAEKRIMELAEKYDFEVDPRKKVMYLSVGEQQRVEILKALYRGAKILILDEPTSVLTPPETKQLFNILRRMADEGKSVIFISHKLDEVMEISDMITVLRKGKVVSTVSKDETSKRELAKMMVGREVIFLLSRPEVEVGEIVLDVQGLFVLDDRGLTAVKNVYLNVRRGEILGIAGVAGNGQKELAEAIVGVRKALKGKIFVDGKNVTNRPPYELMSMGVGYITEDRIGKGLIIDLTVKENLISKVYSAMTRKLFFLDKDLAERYSKWLIKEFDIVAPSPETPAKTLSGGNLQKLLLARELAIEPTLLVASQPTRGLDVGATEYIRERLLEQKKRGTAILLISEDLEEILGLSDRVAVMYEGEIMGVLPVKDVNIEDIGLMMAGAKRLNR